MLKQCVIDEIKALLAANELSQREIARRTGISRGTINAIANSRRAIRGPRPVEDEPAPWFRGPIIRCRGCGGRVYAPCRLCLVRDFKAKERRDVNQRREARELNPTRQPGSRRR